MANDGGRDEQQLPADGGRAARVAATSGGGVEGDEQVLGERGEQATGLVVPHPEMAHEVAAQLVLEDVVHLLAATATEVGPHARTPLLPRRQVDDEQRLVGEERAGFVLGARGDAALLGPRLSTDAAS